MLGSILFASNATTPAAAQAAAAITAATSGAYNQLLVTSATAALNGWMTSNTSAAILNSSSYAGLTIPAQFSSTLLTVTDIDVINATVAADTVESLLGITSSTMHYALEVWLSITVQVGYSVDPISTAVSSRRRLLQHPLNGHPDQLLEDSTVLAEHDSRPTEHSGSMGQLGLGADPDTDSASGDLAVLRLLGSDVGFGVSMHEEEAVTSGFLTSDLHAQLQALAARAAVTVEGSMHGGRRLQQSLGSSWLSPLDLQLALLKAAFAQTAQCNATAVALQLGISFSLSSLNCPSSSTITLLTDLLAASTSESDPALSVLAVSTAPRGSRSTTPVDNTSGLQASLASGLGILLHGYEVEIAEILAMTLQAANTVDTLGGSMAGTYIKAFIATGQRYIATTTTLVNRALAIFDKTLATRTAVISVSAYTQLVQASLAAAVQAQNNEQASPTFKTALAALAPNCTSRDSLGNAQFMFLVAADQSEESFADSSHSVAATAAAAAPADSGPVSVCPPQLRQKGTGYCVSKWNGYAVAQVASMPDRKVVGEQVIGRRRTLGFGGNVVVGGLLLHQVKIPTTNVLLFSGSNQLQYLQVVCLLLSTAASRRAVEVMLTSVSWP